MTFSDSVRQCKQTTIGLEWHLVCLCLVFMGHDSKQTIWILFIVSNGHISNIPMHNVVNFIIYHWHLQFEHNTNRNANIKWTRMHSSRMRTAHLLTYGGDLCLWTETPLPGQRPPSVDRDPLHGQRPPPGTETPLPGQTSPRQRTPWTETPWTETPWTETPWSCDLWCMLAQRPPPMDRQTPVKTLPCPKLRLRAVTIGTFLIRRSLL